VAFIASVVFAAPVKAVPAAKPTKALNWASGLVAISSKFFSPSFCVRYCSLTYSPPSCAYSKAPPPAIGTRVSKFEDDYIKNNDGKKPDQGWYDEAFLSQAALLLGERLGVKKLGKGLPDI
jgi:hypothetical protein